jgi:hypothetical protein
MMAKLVFFNLVQQLISNSCHWKVIPGSCLAGSNMHGHMASASLENMLYSREQAQADIAAALTAM